MKTCKEALRDYAENLWDSPEPFHVLSRRYFTATRLLHAMNKDSFVHFARIVGKWPDQGEDFFIVVDYVLAHVKETKDVRRLKAARELTK